MATASQTTWERQQIKQKWSEPALETQNSPKTPGNGMLKSTCRWRIVSVDIINIYILLIAPVAVPIRNFVFGRVESGGEAIAPSFGGGMASDADVDSTNGSGVDLIWVNQTPKVEMTYQEHARAVQPHGDSPKHQYGIHSPRCRCGRIKIGSINVSRTPRDGNTCLERVTAIRSTWRPKKRIRRMKYSPSSPGWRESLDTMWRIMDEALRPAHIAALQSTQMVRARHELPNRATRRKSRKCVFRCDHQCHLPRNPYLQQCIYKT